MDFNLFATVQFSWVSSMNLAFYSSVLVGSDYLVAEYKRAWNGNSGMMFQDDVLRKSEKEWH